MLTLIAFFAFAGCESKEMAGEEASNLERLKEAFPGARVVPSDPEQLKKLGPSAVPGIFTDAQLAELRKRALAGHGFAAYQLFTQYQLMGKYEEALNWARLGAENGDYYSMMMMGFNSGKGEGRESCVQAIDWFTRAKTKLQRLSQTPGTKALILEADDEIAKARKRTEGC